MLLLYIIFLPLVGIWVISEKTLWFSTLCMGPIMIVFVFSFVCTFYAEIPFMERKNRIRYWLKMNGVNSIAYYLSMFFLDSVMAWFVIASILMTQLYVWRDNFGFIFVQQSQFIFKLVIQTCLWSSSFIAQSYFFSQIISVKNKSAFMVPFMILATSSTFLLVFTSNNS